MEPILTEVEGLYLKELSCFTVNCGISEIVHCSHVIPNVLLPDSLMKVCLFFDYIKRDQAISHLSELVKEDLSCFFFLFPFRIFE